MPNIYPLYEETLTDSIDVLNNPNKTMSLDIPQDKDIQRIFVRLTGVVSGTLSAWLEDNPMALVKKLTLYGGKEIIFNVGMATLWQINAYDFGNVPEITRLTAVGSTAFKATAIYCFQKNAKNLLDVSHVLPAREFPSLKLKAQLGTNTDLCTGATISAAQLDVKLVQCDPNPLKQLFQQREIIRLTEEEETLTGANTSFKYFDIDSVGYKLRRIMVKSIDNGLRSDAFITRVAVQDKKHNVNLVDDSWEMSKVQDLTDYSLSPCEYWNASAMKSYKDEIGTDPTPKGTMRGITFLDFDKARFSEYALRQYLPLQNYRIGDMKLGIINSAGSGTRQLIKVEECQIQRS